MQYGPENNFSIVTVIIPVAIVIDAACCHRYDVVVVVPVFIVDVTIAIITVPIVVGLI